jgi:uncharacterized protein
MSNSHQSRYHARWGHLRNPHVRALAWLLDAPGLLDADAPEWSGRVATLGPASAETSDWLTSLDRSPSQLQAALDLRPQVRLGRYAENLLAYYLRAIHCLYAENLQVHAAGNETIGEFDFLLSDREDASLIHWEFATKFYLLEATGSGTVVDYFVGPDLADTLGAKIRKIMTRQLALSQHPAARAVVPLPVRSAQALVKGWLFYRVDAPLPDAPPGISTPHCRGFWCTQDEAGGLAAGRYVVLARLNWLAPARVASSEAMDRDALIHFLAQRFRVDSTPVLVALLEPAHGALLETDRGFVVPNDWRQRAHRTTK